VDFSGRRSDLLQTFSNAFAHIAIAEFGSNREAFIIEINHHAPARYRSRAPHPALPRGQRIVSSQVNVAGFFGDPRRVSQVRLRQRRGRRDAFPSIRTTCG